ncbi:MAG: hypothetical protein IID05_10460 [Gemmatimonadetes bacterium]|nr:hypothetical protein [Gemmatimonadota bacterium]
MKFGTGLLTVTSLGLIGTAAWGCSSTTVEGCVCDSSFRIAVVTVVDTDGTPVVGVAITVTRVSTEENIEFTPADLPDGVYIILDDGFVDAVDMDGEVFRVVGRKDNAGFMQDYVFGTDVCRCHLTRISGPDSIVMDVNPARPVAMEAGEARRAIAKKP